MLSHLGLCRASDHLWISSRLSAVCTHFKPSLMSAPDSEQREKCYLSLSTGGSTEPGGAGNPPGFKMRNSVHTDASEEIKSPWITVGFVQGWWMDSARHDFKQVLDVSRPALLSLCLGGFFSYHIQKLKAAVFGQRCCSAVRHWPEQEGEMEISWGWVRESSTDLGSHSHPLKSSACLCRPQLN